MNGGLEEGIRRPLLEDRIVGMLLGAACGDVVGMPAAGLTPEEIRGRYGRISGPVAPVPGALHEGLPAGAGTDDTELMLAVGKEIAEAVERRGGFDPGDVARAVVAWAGPRLDDPRLGPSTGRAVRRLLAGAPSEEAGREGDTDGAAARIAPVAALHAGDPRSVDEDVVRACLPTHGTNVAIAAAAAVAAAEAAMLGGARIDRAIDEAARAAERCAYLGLVVPGPSVAARVRLAADLAAREGEPGPAALALARAIGAGVRAVEAIPTALGIALAADGDPVAAILAAANAGDDADTVAAIAGAVCGAGTGPGSLPAGWVDEGTMARIRGLAARLARAHARLRGEG